MPNVGTISVLSGWQEFLERGHPGGVKMPEDQYRETKLAFFAGFGASLIWHRDEIAAMDEDAAIAKMESFVEEIALFLRKAADEFEKKEQEQKEVGALTPEMASKLFATIDEIDKESSDEKVDPKTNHDFSPLCRDEIIAIQPLKEKELQLWTRAKIHSMEKLGKPYPDLSALAREIPKGVHMSPEAQQILARFQVIEKNGPQSLAELDRRLDEKEKK